MMVTSCEVLYLGFMVLKWFNIENGVCWEMIDDELIQIEWFKDTIRNDISFEENRE